MAAEIRPFSGSNTARKMQLLAKLEGHQDIVTAAVIIRGEDGIISISDDKTVRVWLKRDIGNYWPSVCHIMPAPASSLDFNQETKRLFVGMDNGSISEFQLADDYNRLTHIRNYLAHQAKVAAVKFSLLTEWLLSVGFDKYINWHCSETGRRLGGFLCGTWCTALQFDQESKHCFIGDHAGVITMLKIEENGYKPITTLKGHSGAVTCLAWDVQKQMLFSGGADRVIICWDIGGKKGTAYELQGHRNKVTSLCFASASNLLLSASEDHTIVAWNMNAKRRETPEWAESDFCQRCSKPFFWNIKAMYDQKTIGLRQHHCRRCGKAVCGDCSGNQSTIPVMGFEFRVRVCDECHSEITDADRTSAATFNDCKHGVVAMDLDQAQSQLVTAGNDRMLKLWDISDLLRVS